MTRNCNACGNAYEARRPSSKYCSTKCRQRGNRVGDAPIALADEHTVDGSLTAATRAELTSANRLDTTAGVAAMILAARLDARTTDTGSSVAALVREHRVTMTEALRGAVLADPMDELRAKRAARLAG